MSIDNHLNIPSPVCKVSVDWANANGVELYIKRDDLIHPIISGNKWRKLSGILRKYEKANYNGITTFGGAFSNHLVATACACSINKIRCTGIIRGEKPKNLNAVLKLCILYSMHLKFVTRTEYKDINRTEGIKNGELFIPEGGASMEGTIGCETILKETNLTGINEIFVACGTGTTLAGMANYIKREGFRIQLNGVQVLKGPGYIKSDLASIFNVEDVTVYDQFHCGGYAKTTSELVEFITDFTKSTGILLDPIYTGKLLLAIKTLIENKTIKPGTKVLAIHTGGLTGWFGKADLL